MMPSVAARDGARLEPWGDHAHVAKYATFEGLVTRLHDARVRRLQRMEEAGPVVGYSLDATVSDARQLAGSRQSEQTHMRFVSNEAC